MEDLRRRRARSSSLTRRPPRSWPSRSARRRRVSHLSALRLRRRVVLRHDADRRPGSEAGHRRLARRRSRPVKKLQDIGEKGDKALKTSIDGKNAIPLFTGKKTAFLVSGPWAIADIKKAGVPYDISPIPPFADGDAAGPFIGVNGFYVASKGKNKTLAQEFATNFVDRPLDFQVGLYEAEPRRAGR